jgi:hypothetical protein
MGKLHGLITVLIGLYMQCNVTIGDRVETLAISLMKKDCGRSDEVFDRRDRNLLSQDQAQIAAVDNLLTRHYVLLGKGIFDCSLQNSVTWN